jgi:hypothetical protein
VPEVPKTKEELEDEVSDRDRAVPRGNMMEFGAMKARVDVLGFWKISVRAWVVGALRDVDGRWFACG